MLKAGYVLCHKCATATDQAVYSDGENLWLQLKRTATGRFFVERYIPEKFAKDPNYSIDDGYFRFELSEKDSASSMGIKHSIEVACYQKIPTTLPDGKEEFQVIDKKLTLACPFCKDNKVTFLLEGLGNLPTYVIAVVGARTVGKSSWINSIACPENIIKLRNPIPVADGNISYSFVAKEYSEANGQKLASTPIGDMGVTNILTIVKKTKATTRDQSTGQAIANILLVDFAGEIFAKGNEVAFNKTAAHIFSGGAGYNGVDAVLFVTDPKDVRRTERDGKEYSVSETFNRVHKELGLLNNIPFAFILNKVDLLFEKEEDRKLVTIDTLDQIPELPLVSANTFSPQNNAMYQAENLLPRVALETYLLRKFLPTLDAVSITTRCAGFLVKTAEFDSEGKPDYSQSINVFDPLLWILNELDIYPIN